MVCPICKKEDHGTLIICDNCDSTFHLTCVELESQDVDLIANYFCFTCEDKEKLLTIWKKRRASVMERIDKRQNYYEVEKILHHRLTSNGRQFLVKWKGYEAKDNSWIPEESMDGCLDLLQSYLRQHGLPLTKIEGLMGATRGAQVNESNWVSMNHLITEFNVFKLRYYDTVSIKVHEWIDLPDSDGLYFLNHMNHCFVLLFFKQRNLAFIADGGNSFHEDITVAQELKQLLNIRLISCKYNQQLKVDFCGSSAILIGLGMIRAYSLGLKPLNIIAPKKMHSYVTKRLHKYESANLTLPQLHLRQKLPTCSRCHKHFQRSTTMKKHEAKCHGSN